MADNSRTVMTDAGFALEAKVRADETNMQFTRATISTDGHFDDADDALAKLGTLDNVQQDGAITDVKVIDDTTVHVQVDVDQTEAPSDYAMLSAGLYARDGDGNEILYGVIVLKDPAYVHKDDDGSYLGFGIDTVVGRAVNVTVTVSPANVVTQQAFSSVMSDYYDKTAVENLLKNYVTDEDFSSKLPQNIVTTDAANTFAKSQTLAGGATDGKGNAYATTKDVSQGDASTLASAKDYTNTATKPLATSTSMTAGDSSTLASAKAYTDTVGKTKVNVADTSNWQKTKITADDGGVKLRIYADGTSDINATIQSLPAGVHTIYVQTGVKNNPSTDSILGVVTKSEPDYGNGIFMSNASGGYAMWKVVIQGGTDISWQKMTTTNDIASGSLAKRTLTATDDVYTLAPGLYTIGNALPKNGAPGMFYGFLRVITTDGFNIILQAFNINGLEMMNTHFGSPAKWSGWEITNDTKVVNDNGNGTITANGVTYAPVQSDPTSGNIAKVHNFVSGVKINGHLINIDPTNGLTIDGTPMINVVSDEATAKAKSANDKLHVWVTKE